MVCVERVVVKAQPEKVIVYVLLFSFKNHVANLDPATTSTLSVSFQAQLGVRPRHI